MAQPPFDLAPAHRWFAIEFNNAAWDLIEQPQRTADQTQQMLHFAHAAHLHWQSAGTALNRQRAENLLATVYLRAGDAPAALRHAERCLSLSAQNAKEETPFDRATALGCAAQAHKLAGDHAQAQRLQTLAQSAAQALDADDRGVYDKLYG
jgi:hypothetical protein